jgi:DNA-binding MarR family transcriptional regulator
MARTRTEEARDLSGKLFQVGDRMKQDFAAVAASLGLTPLQARTLLGLAQPQPMRSLAEVMLCDASNVTGLADRLERLGLVERVADPSDRRVKLLSLTDRGRQVRRDLDARVGAGSTVTARLTKAERTQLESLLDKLLDE